MRPALHQPGTGRQPGHIRSCWRPVLALVLGLLAPIAGAQEADRGSRLSRTRFRSGEETLRAFAPLASAMRHSIVKVAVDDETVALGAVVDTNGLVLTKASEIRPGRLSCWLADDKKARAELIAVAEEHDVALVRVHARGLKPIQWADTEPCLGQWAITPGVALTPHAVGIVSALPRRIRPQRAYIGVQFDLGTAVPRIEEVITGLGAEKAGLKAGDMIMAVNDATVTNRVQIVDTLRDFHAGQTVKLRVQRQQEQFETQVRMMAPNEEMLGGELYQPGGDRLTGELSQRAEGFEQVIEHDTVLRPWLCGGPLVNLDGKAIGLNIARADRVSTYALPASLVKRILDKLKAMPATTAKPGK